MIPRCTVGRGITGAVRYILGEGRDPHTGALRPIPEDAASRVAWFGGTGFGFEIVSRDDADLARRVMEFDALNQQSRTRRCDKDCVHLSLGWRPGETPTQEQMAQAARDALAAMGMPNARALFAIHNDESYAHIHIVASKIDPATGRAYDLKANYLKLSRWAEQYERAHSGGVVCVRREGANALRDAIDKRNPGAVLEAMTKQRATFTTRDLDRSLGKQIMRTVDRVQFAAEIISRREVVPLSGQAGGPVIRYTTKPVLAAEAEVLRAAEKLTQGNRHGVGDAMLASVLGRERFKGVTDEQARAIRHATGSEGLALIDGQAGTGKSYTLSAIREVYERNGYRVIGLAPTNAVAQDMQRDGFRRASTLHAELFALNNGRARWNGRTVVVLDEAAMIDTALMASLTAQAARFGAKLVMVGDDRQLSSIDRGGLFALLKERHGAAELTQVRRQSKSDERRATELMAEGNFYDALARYADKGAIRWTRTQDEARAALVEHWDADSDADPGKSRFVFAYTNDDVDRLNRDLRRIREVRRELGISHTFDTKHGQHDFAAGDRIQLTGTNKALGLYNGNAGVVESIEGNRISLRLDGGDRTVAFDTAEFRDFRLGYAGTIYKGQGRTLDQTYLYHSEHWRSAPSYVALSRHREKVELFVARNTARDLRQLARQMARVEERRAALHFHRLDREPMAGPAPRAPPRNPRPEPPSPRFALLYRHHRQAAPSSLWRRAAAWLTGRSGPIRPQSLDRHRHYPPDW